MKLFITKSYETVKYCQEYVDLSLPSVLSAKRLSKFDASFERFLSVMELLFRFDLIRMLYPAYCCLPINLLDE